MIYYVDKNINKADGTNSFETFTFQKFSSAVSKFHTLKGELIRQSSIPSFCLGVRDSEGNQVIDWELTQCPDYVPAEPAGQAEGETATE
ncbi:MAG: hypothetical protein Q4B85_06720 [Lachnospiraceae bacterium]|nr:hypothetical protein [Lachnospiraceae bacterium]